jgi:hypothetical protein
MILWFFKYMLTLNTTKINLKSLRITASQTLASEDASGQSSSTDVAETGTKAKMLNVSGLIAFENAEHLAQLFKLAEATEDAARTIYRINNNTASALGVKQVRFSSKIEAAEQEITRQWRISFSLAEYRSVPQKVEERQPETTANVQGDDEAGVDANFSYANIQQNLENNFSKLRNA